MYSSDLAFVHDAGFGDLAAEAAAAIVSILKDHGIRDGTIVELGCGSGITAAHLAARGYRVVGIDASSAMIRLARRRAPAATFITASINAARIPRCRAAIAVGEVIGYVPGGLPALRLLLRRVHAALAPGGLLIFDFMASAVGRTYRQRTASGSGWHLTSQASYDRVRRILTRRIVVVRRRTRSSRSCREVHRVRIYSRDEVRNALEGAGFAVRMSRSYGHHPLLPGDVVAIAERV